MVSDIALTRAHLARMTAAAGASASPAAAAPTVAAPATGPAATTGGPTPPVTPPTGGSGGSGGGSDPKEITVTIRQVGRGSLKVNVGDREIGRGIFKAKVGDTLTLIAAAGFRHFLYNIKKNGSDIGGVDASYFTVLAEDLTVIVEFKKKESDFSWSFLRNVKLIPVILALALLASFAVQWRLSAPEWAARQTGGTAQQAVSGSGNATAEAFRASIVSNCEAKDDGSFTSYHRTNGCSLTATTGDKPMVVGKFKVTHMIGTTSIKYVPLACGNFQEQSGSRQVRIGDIVEGCFGVTTGASGASFTINAV